MGQGVYTAIAMILAEELDVRWEQVRLEAAPPNDKLYGNPTFGIQVTGNSNSIRAFWMPLRKAGASARAMLIEAAARRWKVDSATCRAADSEVIHAASGRRLAYAALIDDASSIPPPKDPQLKTPADFKIVGKPLKRLDTPDKVNGKVIYGIDVMPPGVKFATLAACPVFGGKVAHVDDTKAKQVPGVRQIVVLDDLVAVIGDHMWAVKQGLAALNISWDEGPNAKVNSEAVWRQIRAASEKTGVVARTEGDVAKALSEGTRLDAAYEMPFLAHAPMEPLNCTVHVRPDACEVWVGIQVLSRAQAIAAKVTGLPLEKVVVHNHLIGGGFGRRLEVDMVETAVRIAKQVDGPVKVVWSREEDIQHDIYRPVYRDVLSASVANGRIAGWTHRITGSSILARWFPAAFRRASTAMPSIAAPIFRTTFRICASNICATSRPPCRPDSGAASGPTTTCSRSKASSMSLRRRPARIRWPFAATCLAKVRGCAPPSIWPRAKPVGEARCPRAADEASPHKAHSAASSPPSSKWRSTITARSA